MAPKCFLNSLQCTHTRYSAHASHLPNLGSFRMHVGKMLLQLVSVDFACQTDGSYMF